MRKVIIMLFVVALAAFAQGKGKAKGRGHGQAADAAYLFLPEHRDVIVDYYRAAPGGLPPGLAKRGDLPPGLAKQLRRNGHLPPGLEKKLVAFPQRLDARLPPLPAGYERGIVANIAIIWNPHTRVVLDVLSLD